jgi:hypothetical protein
VTRIFEHYSKMIDSLHDFSYKNGFNLEHFCKNGRIGFKNKETHETWHMNELVWEDTAPDFVKEAYKTDEGKDKYLSSLQLLFSSPHKNTKSLCKGFGCSRAPKKKKKGFCGWCFKKYEKGFLTESGEQIKSVRDRKKDVSEKLTSAKLRLFAEENPKYTETFGCPTLNHFVDPVVCLGRLFLQDKKQCRRCEIHKDLAKELEEFLNREVEDA